MKAEDRSVKSNPRNSDCRDRGYGCQMPQPDNRVSRLFNFMSYAPRLSQPNLLGGDGLRETAHVVLPGCWERNFIKKVVRLFRTREEEDLEAELWKELLQLQSQHPSHITHYKRYVAKLLLNQAANLVRNWRTRDRRTFKTLERCDGDALLLRRISPSDEIDQRLIFLEVWTVLEPRLRRLWLLLLEENGNQTRVSMRIQKHRNTVRLWIREIKALLRKHGLTER